MSTTLSVTDAILIGLLDDFTQYQKREQRPKYKKKGSGRMLNKQNDAFFF
jgi:hypothetical protein